jgi:hypothetical protein
LSLLRVNVSAIYTRFTETVRQGPLAPVFSLTRHTRTETWLAALVAVNWMMARDD